MPFEIEELLLVADMALGERALRNKVERLQREVEDRFGLGNIIAKSQACRMSPSLVQRIAGSTASVLVTGEQHGQGAHRARDPPARSARTRRSSA